VVPIPASSGWIWAWEKISRLAQATAWRSFSDRLTVPPWRVSTALSAASAASWLAICPALWPPMPSATRYRPRSGAMA
jgi:hypothetical protein